MTNNQLTPAEVNAKLAEGDGWKYHEENVFGEQWLSPAHDWHIRPPDYCGDWEHAGPKMVELWEAGCDMFYDKVDKTYAWSGYNDYGDYPLDDDREETTDVKMATAYDYLAWKAELARREEERCHENQK